MSVYPTLLVGLGEQGTAAVDHAYGFICESRPELLPLVKVLVLREDGFVLKAETLPVGTGVPREDHPGSSRDASKSSRPGGTGEPTLGGEPALGNDEVVDDDAHTGTGADMGTGADTGMDAHAGTLVVPVEALRSGGEGAWRANAEAVEAVSGEVAAAVREAVQAGLTLRADLPLNVGRGVRIFVATGLADAVGSAALIPVLQAAHGTRRFFQNTPRQTHLALFVPERTSLGGQAHARAAAVIKELELALDHGEERFSSGPLADDAWVFARQNANGMFAERMEDLFPVFARLVEVTVSGEALGDQSYRGIFQASLLGQQRRYSAVGSASLQFPREAVVDTALDAVTHGALRGRDLVAEVSVPATEAYAQSRSFIRRLKLEKLVDLLRVDVDDNEIHRPFAPRVSAGDASGMRIIEDVARAAKEHEEGALAEMRRALGARRDDLWEQHRSALLQEVGATLDRSESGGGAQALAWLAAFEGVPSEFVTGEADDRPLTLDALDRSVRGYFDSHFEPLLLGDIVDEDRADYVSGRPIGRRELLDRAVLDLETKRRNLERAKGTLKLLLNDLDKLAGDAEALPGVAGEDGSASSPSSHTDTEADVEDRRAGSRAAHESQLETMQRRVVEAHADVESFENDVDHLVGVVERTRVEVAQLDRALTDAAQRRYLFDQLLVSFRDTRAEREKRFQEAVKSEGRARSAAAEARRRRRKATAVAVAVSAGLALVVFGVVGWFQGWGDPTTIRTTSAVAGIGALVALGVWLARSAACRSAESAIEEAGKAKSSALNGIVQAYRSHYAEQFEHALFASLADWRTGVRRFVESLRETLEAFRRDLEAFTDRAPDLGLPEGDSVTEYVLPVGGIDAVTEQRADQVRHRLGDFWEAHPPSQLLSRYRAAGEEAFGLFSDELRRHLEPAFADIRDMTLDQFLEEAFTSAEGRARVVQQAFRKAAPYVSISEYGAAVEGARTSGPQVESVVYANVWSPDSDGPVIAALEHIGVAPRVGKGPSETEAHFLRLDLGFAAFQIAPFVEAYHDLKARPAGERDTFYSSAGVSRSARPLIPSSLELGDASSRPRRTACLALAYGLADADSGEGSIRQGNSVHATYADWVRHLTSYQGRADLDALEAEIRAYEGRSEGSDLQAELERCERIGAWDEVEEEILKSEIYKHSTV